jgi:hypothetical protein
MFQLSARAGAQSSRSGSANETLDGRCASSGQPVEPAAGKHPGGETTNVSEVGDDRALEFLSRNVWMRFRRKLAEVVENTSVFD